MNRLIRALKRRLVNYKRARFTRDHKVGPHVIALPPGNLSDAYQEAFAHYDRPLPPMVSWNAANVFDVDEKRISPRRWLAGLWQRLAKLSATAPA